MKKQLIVANVLLMLRINYSPMEILVIIVIDILIMIQLMMLLVYWLNLWKFYFVEAILFV